MIIIPVVAVRRRVVETGTKHLQTPWFVTGKDFMTTLTRSLKTENKEQSKMSEFLLNPIYSLIFPPEIIL